MRAAIDRAAGVFETMLMLNGRLLERDGHMGRLAESVEAVYGARIPLELERELENLVPRRRALIRVSVWPIAGSVASRVEVEPQVPGHRPLALTLIPLMVDGGLGCHKWRDRSWLEEQRRSPGRGAEVELLLLDSDGEVLETERAAVLILEDGRLVAAPDDARRLPSLTRRMVLAAAERLGLARGVEPIGFERLLAAEQVLAASSVRLVVGAAACGDRRWRLTDDAQRLTTALLDAQPSSS